MNQSWGPLGPVALPCRHHNPQLYMFGSPQLSNSLCPSSLSLNTWKWNKKGKKSVRRKQPRPLADFTHPKAPAPRHCLLFCHFKASRPLPLLTTEDTSLNNCFSLVFALLPLLKGVYKCSTHSAIITSWQCTPPAWSPLVSLWIPLFSSYLGLAFSVSFTQAPNLVTQLFPNMAY